MKSLKWIQKMSVSNYFKENHLALYEDFSICHFHKTLPMQHFDCMAKKHFIVTASWMFWKASDQ